MLVARFVKVIVCFENSKCSKNDHVECSPLPKFKHLISEFVIHEIGNKHDCSRKRDMCNVIRPILVDDIESSVNNCYINVIAFFVEFVNNLDDVCHSVLLFIDLFNYNIKILEMKKNKKKKLDVAQKEQHRANPGVKTICYFLLCLSCQARSSSVMLLPNSVSCQ